MILARSTKQMTTKLFVRRHEGSTINNSRSTTINVVFNSLLLRVSEGSTQYGYLYTKWQRRNMPTTPNSALPDSITKNLQTYVTMYNLVRRQVINMSAHSAWKQRLCWNVPRQWCLPMKWKAAFGISGLRWSPFPLNTLLTSVQVEFRSHLLVLGLRDHF